MCMCICNNNNVNESMFVCMSSWEKRICLLNRFYFIFFFFSLILLVVYFFFLLLLFQNFYIKNYAFGLFSLSINAKSSQRSGSNQYIRKRKTQLITTTPLLLTLATFTNIATTLTNTQSTILSINFLLNSFLFFQIAIILMLPFFIDIVGGIVGFMQNHWPVTIIFVLFFFLLHLKSFIFIESTTSIKCKVVVFVIFMAI